MIDDNKIEKAKEIIAKSNNIVFFGGAGVSTESGIPDFRSESGIYNSTNKYGESPEVILSNSYFKSSPKAFYKYYRENLIHKNADPNYAHIAIANLEKEGKMKAVITQNVDGLHQKAGSKNVLELHGSVYRNYCMDCDNSYELEYILKSKDLPICSCGGLIKPDVVLYQEPLDNKTVQLAIDYISDCEVLVVGGTSLSVYPAAGLLEYFKGNKLILINKDKTIFDSHADLIINEAIGEVFKKIHTP